MLKLANPPFDPSSMASTGTTILLPSTTEKLSPTRAAPHLSHLAHPSHNATLHQAGHPHRPPSSAILAGHPRWPSSLCDPHLSCLAHLPRNATLDHAPTPMPSSVMSPAPSSVMPPTPPSVTPPMLSALKDFCTCAPFKGNTDLELAGEGHLRMWRGASNAAVGGMVEADIDVVDG